MFIYNSLTVEFYKTEFHKNARLGIAVLLLHVKTYTEM